MIPEKLMEIRHYQGEGFQPQIIYQAWRVAYLNYMDAMHPATIDTLERHLETDEVFVLLTGQALLFLGSGAERVEQMHVQVMEPGVVYNLKPACWHTVVGSRDVSILIVENADTGEANSAFVRLTVEERQYLLQTARRLQPGLWD